MYALSVTTTRTLISVALVACNSAGGQAGPDGAVEACTSDVSQPPYTPGLVACVGGPCAAGDCKFCWDPELGFSMTDQYCVTNGIPAGLQCGFATGCDGPEDCDAGESCWAFESSWCSTHVDSNAHRVCHDGVPCARCP